MAPTNQKGKNEKKPRKHLSVAEKLQIIEFLRLNEGFRKTAKDFGLFGQNW